MHRKAFRCGVLALLLATALAPAIQATPGSRSLRPAIEPGFFDRAWELVAGLLGRKDGGAASNGSGLTHLISPNRGGIDPNGAPTNQGTTCPPVGSGSGDLGTSG